MFKVRKSSFEGMGLRENIKDLNIVTYTNDALKRSLGDNKAAQESQSRYRGRFAGYINDILEKFYCKDYMNVGIPESGLMIHVGVLDNEYYEQLGKDKDTTEARMRYVAGLPEDKATELLKKYHKDYSLGLYGISVSAAFKYGIWNGTEFKLDSKTRKSIRECIKKSLPDESIVYVYDYVLKPDIFVLEADDIFDDGFSSIVNSRDIIRGSRHEQKYLNPEVNLIRFYIPVMIGRREESAFVRADDWTSGRILQDNSLIPDHICFAEGPEKYAKGMIPATVSFTSSGAEKAINDQFVSFGAHENGIFVSPILLLPDEVAQTEEKFVNELRKIGKDKAVIHTGNI